MDGSHTVLGHLLGSDGLPYSPTLSRIICYGEALRAVNDHVSDQIITGPYEPMIDLLDDAYDRFARSRVTYAPEEFAIFVMSLLLDLCKDEQEASKLRLGAARYILRSAPILPDDYAAIIESARRIYRTNEVAHLVEDDAPSLARVTHSEKRKVKQEHRSEKEDRGVRTQGPGPLQSHRAQRIHLLEAPRGTRPLQQSDPATLVPKRQPMPRATRQEKLSNRPPRRESGVLEKVIAILILSIFMLYLLLLAFGLFDASPNPVRVTRFE